MVKPVSLHTMPLQVTYRRHFIPFFSRALQNSSKFEKCLTCQQQTKYLHFILRFVTSHLPGMMMLEKPSFLVTDTPCANTEEHSRLICSMSPCSSWRDTAKPETSERAQGKAELESAGAGTERPPQAPSMAPLF